MAADPNGDAAFWSKVQKEELPHCGLCDPETRQVDLDDGRIGRCPRCHPLQDALLPQAWRCPACHALVYRDQRGLPCDRHRTIAGWHREYDQGQAGAEPLLPSPATEAGAKAARTQLADRPRPARPAPPEAPATADTTGLHGEALARAQLAEIAARRQAEELLRAAPEDGDDDDPGYDDDDDYDPEEPPPGRYDDDPDVPY
jgi:hypothetical protein